jgi:hypothetical protein
LADLHLVELKGLPFKPRAHWYRRCTQHVDRMCESRCAFEGFSLRMLEKRDEIATVKLAGTGDALAADAPNDSARTTPPLYRTGSGRPLPGRTDPRTTPAVRPARRHRESRPVAAQKQRLSEVGFHEGEFSLKTSPLCCGK